MKGFEWALGVESQDGVATEVDVNKVESETEVSDLDQGNLDVDNANAESQDADVKASTTVDISVEDAEYAQASAASNIEASGLDTKSNSMKRFVLSGFDATNNPAAEVGDDKLQCVILFQNGVLPEVGKNGVTAEDLLNVIQEVYEGYQSGPFACEENESVLSHIRAAKAKIQARLDRRQSEGTEGTYTGN